MSPEEILTGAKNILAKRVGENTFRVAVDSPKDCDQTVKAFKKLGCKAKTDNDGKIVIVTRPTA